MQVIRTTPGCECFRRLLAGFQFLCTVKTLQDATLLPKLPRDDSTPVLVKRPLQHQTANQRCMADAKPNLHSHPMSGLFRVVDTKSSWYSHSMSSFVFPVLESPMMQELLMREDVTLAPVVMSIVQSANRMHP